MMIPLKSVAFWLMRWAVFTAALNMFDWNWKVLAFVFGANFLGWVEGFTTRSAE